jgi:glycosyltransferase involved in cell wall biosynthesis
MIVVNFAPSLLIFRKELIKEFIIRKNEVVALAPENSVEIKKNLEKVGISYIPIQIIRASINPIRDIKTFLELYKIIRQEKPDLFLAYTAKPVVYGCLAAKLNRTKNIFAMITGLGSMFCSKSIKALFIKELLKVQYKLSLRTCIKVFFLNNDDKDEFILSGLVKKDKTVIINGEGVNLDKFKPAPYPSEKAFLFIGRLIKDKGIVEYLKACKVVKKKYPKIRCLLVGPYDSNPSALRKEELQTYMDNGIIEYFGEQMDVRPFIAKCSTYVFPSYREGTPKSILEAMAIGRPIITTDMPGCRETVINNVNGFLIPARNFEILADKMIWMIENVEKAKKMGEESIRICIDKYDVKKVNKEVMRAMGINLNKQKIDKKD